MTALLTLNGIPPQIIGSMPERDRLVVMDYGQTDKTEYYYDWRHGYPEVIRNFAETVAVVADSFTAWGASILESWQRISFHSDKLDFGGTTFITDFNLHEDAPYFLQDFHAGNTMIIRMLCVSNDPADFIDLTAKENAKDVLQKYRIEKSRVFKPQLLTLAREEGLVIRPNPWDYMLFDAGTPHNPRGVLKACQRILMNAWVPVKLSPDWGERVASGDVPKLNLGHLTQ